MSILFTEESKVEHPIQTSSNPWGTAPKICDDVMDGRWQLESEFQSKHRSDVTVQRPGWTRPRPGHQSRAGEYRFQFRDPLVHWCQGTLGRIIWVCHLCMSKLVIKQSTGNLINENVYLICLHSSHLVIKTFCFFLKLWCKWRVPNIEIERINAHFLQYCISRSYEDFLISAFDLFINSSFNKYTIWHVILLWYEKLYSHYLFQHRIYNVYDHTVTVGTCWTFKKNEGLLLVVE